jgi:hypothetical protein
MQTNGTVKQIMYQYKVYLMDKSHLEQQLKYKDTIESN